MHIDCDEISTPVISVIMGVQGTSHKLPQLKRAVNSILAQSFSDFEFLICDDGSDTATINYFNHLLAIDSRIRLIRVGNLSLLAQKLNACIKNARGIYIARMDDDDVSHTTRLEEQLAWLNDHPQISFAGSAVNIVQNNSIQGVRLLPSFPAIYDFYITQPYVHPTLIFAKKALISINGYNETKRCDRCEDYDLLLRLYIAGFQGGNVPVALLDYTVPQKGIKNRTMQHRYNEAYTRFFRFKDLQLLPKALPYVLKPLLTGLLPTGVLQYIQQKRNCIDIESRAI